MTDKNFRKKLKSTEFFCRLFCVVIFVAIVFLGSVCSAKISADRFFLGGLTVGSKMSDAIKIYGKEDFTYNDDDGTKCYVYSKTGNVDLQFAVRNGKIFAISLHSSV